MRSTPLLALLLLVAFVSGCDSTEDVTMDDLAGDYTATQFEADLGDGSVDVLGLGGSLSISLDDDGSVDGLLVVPDGFGEGESEIPFAGTFSVSGDRVQFDHEADTFVRDALWVYSNGQLRSTSFNSNVVLER